MKIKNLVIYYPSFERGGVEKIIINLINFFSKNYNIKIFLISTLNTQLKQFKNIKNVKLIQAKNKKSFLVSNRISTSFNCLNPLKSLLKKLDKNNTVVHSMQSSFFPILLCKLKGFKIVIRNSEDPIHSIRYADNKISSYIIFILRFFFYNLADLIVTNSKGSSSSIKFFLFGSNIMKVKSIYNPYLKEKIIRKNNSKKNVILGVGRLTSQKNFEDLIYAFSKFSMKHKNYILNIIGDGYQMSYLREIVKKLNLENRVFLKGYKKNVEKEYMRAKIFVLPSVYEGLGNVLIDALRLSIPCISTNCKSGPEEILCYGKGGIVVQKKNIKALYKALELSVNKYSLSMQKMRYAQKKLVRFDANNQSSKYIKFLNSALR